MESTETTVDLDSYARHLKDTFNPVREALKNEQKARENTLRERYAWGREVQDALDDASRGDGLAEKVAEHIDKTPQYVWNHAKWYRAVKEKWPDEEIEAYIRDCHDFDRNLTWSDARTWAEDSSDEDVDTTHEAIDEQKKRTERALGRAEEEYTRLQKMSQEARDELPDAELEEVVGVMSATAQALSDSDPDKIPIPDHEKTENRAYLDWVKSHECCVCGQKKPNMDPHHLDPVGVATKGSDFLAVPLCRDCHDRLDSVGMDAVSFFRREGVNPYEVASELMAKLLGRINSLESSIDVLTPSRSNSK